MGNKCLSCGNQLMGRSDKKYCDVYCKSNFHYRSQKLDSPKLFNRIDAQLKLNRKLLKYYNKAGKVTIRADIMIDEGFNPNYFTHYWKNSKGNVYLFVYEFGYFKQVEHSKDKYVLIKWQDYMEKQFR